MTGDNDGTEDRRSSSRLSEEELEAVAKRAAELVWESFTLQVGKTTIRLVLYVCGAVFLVITAWLGLYKGIKL